MGGIAYQELERDTDRAQELLEKHAQYFEPGILGVGFSPLPSRTLGDRHTKWLGYGLGSNGTCQFFEGENMKAREYDAFLDDLTDFTVCTFLPRAYSDFQSLTELPRMPMMLLGRRAPGNIRVLADLA